MSQKLHSGFPFWAAPVYHVFTMSCVCCTFSSWATPVYPSKYLPFNALSAAHAVRTGFSSSPHVVHIQAPSTLQLGHMRTHTSCISAIISFLGSARRPCVRSVVCVCCNFSSWIAPVYPSKYLPFNALSAAHEIRTGSSSSPHVVHIEAPSALQLGHMRPLRCLRALRGLALRQDPHPFVATANV